MKSETCNNCNIEIYPIASFCHKCGHRLKCEKCGTSLVKDANNCISCGFKIAVNSSDNTSVNNTITYRKTNDEIFFDASLSDNVAKDGIGSLISSITNNRLPEGKLPNKEIDNIGDKMDSDSSETLDIESEEIAESTNKENTSTEFPHISDVEMNVDCSEAEWIAIYAFYESDFSRKTFSRKAVYDRYIHKRKSDSHLSNFSKNWKSLFKLYFSTVSDNEIKFKSDSTDHIENLITGKEKGTIKNYSKRTTKKPNVAEVEKVHEDEEKKSTKPKIRSSLGVAYKLVPELNLHPKDTDSLIVFHGKYETKNTAEIILLIVYYLQKKIKEPNIDVNKIYTCYKELGLAVPIMHKAFDNIKRRNGYLNSADFNNVTITLAGENHIEHKMNKKVS
ncbi:zinc ribbon domain-containing protein [Mucilaginibacter aquariorum]|uniref:Zinc ribbon domain-containing protein n=1 Tax=Mucilaginibacter aquariorum TaxID=2967225 RepID=A0ABT1T714_9SPHI|nr:zinc ribbon domain-containing protein [Mucilaginibacter aquariorum]MCQ6960422.1 zinc ribbon domain-containing protein [Mucilaginibacter aquariorum]